MVEYRAVNRLQKVILLIAVFYFELVVLSMYFLLLPCPGGVSAGTPPYHLSKHVSSLSIPVNHKYSMQTVASPTKSKPRYLLGLLCFIPLVGAFVGLGLLLYGLLKYKDKWLSIIGAAGILWTITVYSLLFYAGSHVSVFTNGFKDLSQMQLNSLVKSVEFYNLSHGEYPDSLKQLLDDDKSAIITDAVQGMTIKAPLYYNYQKVGDRYLLFSSGQDGIPNTADDLFPHVAVSDSSRIGLIQR